MAPPAESTNHLQREMSDPQKVTRKKTHDLLRSSIGDVHLTPRGGPSVPPHSRCPPGRLSAGVPSPGGKVLPR